MLPEFGGDTYAGADNFMNGRTNGVATYRNNGFFGQVDGLNFALQYQGRKVPVVVMAVAFPKKMVMVSVCQHPTTSTSV